MSKNTTRYSNIYFVSESMSEPKFIACVPSADVEGELFWLRRDDEIPEDCDDRYYSEPASVYA